MQNLDELRVKINAVDKELAKLFEERMHVVLQIAQYKKENNLPVFDPIREQAMKEKNLAYLQDKNLSKLYLEFLDACLKVSKDYQREQLNLKN